MDQTPFFKRIARAIATWSSAVGSRSVWSALASRHSAQGERAGVDEYKRLMDNGLRPSHVLRRRRSDAVASLVLCRETPKRP